MLFYMLLNWIYLVWLFCPFLINPEAQIYSFFMQVISFYTETTLNTSRKMIMNLFPNIFFFTIYCSDECVDPHTNKLYSVCCYKRLWNSLSGALCEATVGPQEKMSHDSLHRITQSTTLPTLGEFIIYTVVLWIE